MDDEYYLHSATLEVRYANNFRHFDAAGAFWTDIADQWSIVEDESSPQQTSFRVRGKFMLRAGVDRASLVAYGQQVGMEEILDGYDFFFSRLKHYFRPVAFNRVGVRARWEKEIEKSDIRSEISSSLGLEPPDAGPTLGLVDAKLINMSVSARWEDETHGYFGQLSTPEPTVSVDIPEVLAHLAGELSIEKSWKCISLDIDSYTKAPMLVEQLVPSSYAEEQLEALESYVCEFFKLGEANGV